WLWYPKTRRTAGPSPRETPSASPLGRSRGPRSSSPIARSREERQGEGLRPHEILRCYGREAHPAFDVYAHDRSQRTQEFTNAFGELFRASIRRQSIVIGGGWSTRRKSLPKLLN